MRQSLPLVVLLSLSACVLKPGHSRPQNEPATMAELASRCAQAPCAFLGSQGDSDFSLTFFRREEGYWIGFSSTNGQEEWVGEAWNVPALSSLLAGEALRLSRTHSSNPSNDTALLTLELLPASANAWKLRACRDGACSPDLTLARRPPSRFRLGTYNIENLWDDKDSSSAYSEYRGDSSNWISAQMPFVKAKRAAEVVALMGSPEILAIHELESDGNSGRAAEILFGELRGLGYTASVLAPQELHDPDAVTSAVFTKFPVLRWGTLPTSERAGSGVDGRDPLFVDLDTGEGPLRIYTSHWLSKRGNDAAAQEEKRRKAARVLVSHIEKSRQQDPSLDIVVVGDLNTNLNDTALSGIETALDGVLGSSGDEAGIRAGSQALYNLWFELPFEKRGSTAFFSRKCTLDHMLLASSLFDGKGVDYVDGSFGVIGSKGLAARILLNPDGNPFRWAISEKEGKFIHLGTGYSDHLPLVAEFRKGVAPDPSLPPTSKVARETRASLPLVESRPCIPGKAHFVTLQELQAKGLQHPSVVGHCLSLDGVSLPLRRGQDGSLSFRLGETDVALGVAWDRGSECPTAKGRAAEFPSNCRFAEELAFTGAGRQVRRVSGRIAWIDSASSFGILVENPETSLALSGETDLSAPVPPRMFPRCHQPTHALWDLKDLNTKNAVSHLNKCFHFSELEITSLASPRPEGDDAVAVGEFLLPPSGRKVSLVVAAGTVPSFSGRKCKVSGYATLLDRGSLRLQLHLDKTKTGELTSIFCQ